MSVDRRSRKPSPAANASQRLEPRLCKEMERSLAGVPTARGKELQTIPEQRRTEQNRTETPAVEEAEGASKAHSERQGQDRTGRERKGKERRAKERKGRDDGESGGRGGRKAAMRV